MAWGQNSVCSMAVVLEGVNGKAVAKWGVYVVGG